MRRVLNGGDAESVMWCAALATGFCLLARGCEIALDDGEPPDPLQHLVPADVHRFRAKRRTARAADDEETQGPQDAARQTCASRAIGRRERLRRGGAARAVAGAASAAGDQLRRAALLPPEPNGRGVTVVELRVQVKRVMAAAGLDPARFGAHSLRIGGATAALAAGVQPALIRLMGRWSSDITRYTLGCRWRRRWA